MKATFPIRRLFLLALFAGGGLGMPSLHVLTHPQVLPVAASATHLHAGGAEEGATDALPPVLRGPACVLCSAVFYGMPMQERAFVRSGAPVDLFLPGVSRLVGLLVSSSNAIRGPPFQG